jgi:K(+)-stimulated pyrophosphate-energized sodium pump
MPNIAFFAPVFGAAGLAVAFFIYLHIKKLPDGNERMREIAGLIHSGAMVYLRQYAGLVVFMAVVAALAAFISAYGCRLFAGRLPCRVSA